MKLIQVNDVHTSAKPPRYRTDSYNDDIFDKLWQLDDIIYEAEFDREETYICFTGDLFHQPQPHKVPSWLIKRWMELLESLCDRCKVLIVPGNHDLISTGMFFKQPIALLGHIPGVRVFDKPGWITTDSGHTIQGIPWEHYANAEAVWQKVCPTNPIDEILPPDVLLIHGAVAVDPNPFYSTISADKLAGIAKVVCHGHLHSPEQPYILDGTTFVNPGAISRGSLTATDLTRTPQVGIITVERDKPIITEYRPLNCRPAAEIFRIEEAEAIKESNEAARQFVASLSEAKLDSVGPAGIESEIERLCADEPDLYGKALEILRHVS